MEVRQGDGGAVSGVHDMRCAGTVLVVDDRIDELAFISFGLRRRGHAVLEARSVAQALELSANHRCHVGVVVPTLPDGDGMRFIARMRAGKPFGAVVLCDPEITLPNWRGVVELSRPAPIVAIAQAVERLLEMGPVAIEAVE